MKILNNQLNINAFFSSLSATPLPLLLLDYDGTLSPFTPDRDHAYPYNGVVSRLNNIMATTRTKIIIITGRSIDDLLNLLQLESLPEIWGGHGFEHILPSGKRFTTPLKSDVTDALLAYKKAITDNGLLPYCESKPAGFAVHWRGLSQAMVATVRNKLIRISASINHPALEIQHFDGGMELRHAGINKGFVVDTILSDQQKTFSVAYLGDDLTDEDAFKKIGNKGLKVLVRREIRTTLADLQLTPPEDLIWFLDNWLKNV